MDKRYLKRDPKSGALLNTNREEVIEYKKRIERIIITFLKDFIKKNS